MTGDRPLVPHRGTSGLSPALFAGLPPGASVCAGYSGGLDSTVLLDLLHRHARGAGRPIAALHVHHGLSPNADAWARHCEASCAARGIALDVVRVAVPRDAPQGLEGAARAARYACYAARAEDFVALGHHREDQAETVLLQALRGTGMRGLAAMPQRRALPGSRVQVFRPLLEVPRTELLAYARERGLAWIEDESNLGVGADRNYLRHEVLPLLDARFEGWRTSVARLARHAAQAQELLEALARLDGAPLEAGAPLRLDAHLAPGRRANAVREFLAVNGLAMPGEARLAEMARQLYEAAPDARVELRHDGQVLRRRRDEAFVQREAPAPAPGWAKPWHGEREIALPHGRVTFEPCEGRGIAAERAAQGPWHFAARRGGERLRLAPAGPSRTLKNLLQERSVPAWERARLPLLFAGEQLVWAPGIGIAAEYACAPSRPGLAPCWRVAGRAPLC